MAVWVSGLVMTVRGTALILVDHLSQAGRVMLGQARRALDESNRAIRLARLAAGRIDAGFLRAAEAPPGIRLPTLLTEPVLAALPADHRLARHIAAQT